MKSATEDEIIAHCEAVAREIPLVGFYLQPAVGGVTLGAGFWRRFAAIDNVIAIKVAPFTATARSTYCAAWPRPGRRPHRALYRQ